MRVLVRVCMYVCVCVCKEEIVWQGNYAINDNVTHAHAHKQVNYNSVWACRRAQLHPQNPTFDSNDNPVFYIKVHTAK